MCGIVYIIILTGQEECPTGMWWGEQVSGLCFCISLLRNDKDIVWAVTRTSGRCMTGTARRGWGGGAGPPPVTPHPPRMSTPGTSASTPWILSTSSDPFSGVGILSAMHLVILSTHASTSRSETVLFHWSTILTVYGTVRYWRFQQPIELMVKK